MLGACAATALLAFGLFQIKPSEATVSAGPRPELEIVRIDDTIDPFAELPEQAIPEGERIELRFENAPAGPGKYVKVNFARLVLREGESIADGAVRFRRWLSTIALPPDARFGIEQVEDDAEEGATPRVIGFRSFVLTGEPVLRTEDVTEAAAMAQTGEGMDVYVSVTFSSAGAQRFEDVTREWTQRRLAIVVDGVINSAPVVKTAIGGGRTSITMGAGDPTKRAEEAKLLAARLRGR
jgi:preprotein translocase subunit SecD